MEFTELKVLPIYQKTEHERIEMRVSRDSFFRYYVRIGKAFFDTMDEVWRPTKDGATLPLNIESAQQLLLALTDLLSLAETRGFLDAGFKDTINFDLQRGTESSIG